MTVNGLLNDVTILGVFLIIGFLVREFIKPLQKLFIPAAIIGGIIALILGQQVLGIIEIPPSFSSYSGALIRIIMAALIFGVTINFDKVKSYGDYMMVVHSVYGLQMFVGIGLGALFISIWPILPTGWGFQGVQSFYGGHGTAGAAGAVFEELTGSADVLGIGLVLSTFGLIAAITIGMVIVNYGVRKGWTKFVDKPEKQPNHFYGGSLPEIERKSIGKVITTPISINALGLQLAWILLAIFLGDILFGFIEKFIPIVGKMPQLTYATVGALILWPILRFLKLDKFVDKTTINQIGGLCLEVLILGSMATLSIKVITTFLIPLLLFTLIMVILTFAWTLFFAKKICKDQWFEKAIMICGQSTGATPTGLTLVRTIDPNNNSVAPEAHGIYSGLFFWTTFFTGLLPISLVTGNLSVGIIAGIIQFVICVIIGFLVFGKSNRNTERAL